MLAVFVSLTSEPSSLHTVFGSCEPTGLHGTAHQFWLTLAFTVTPDPDITPNLNWEVGLSTCFQGYFGVFTLKLPESS